MTRVGHNYCAKAVMENKALLGGQYSGHMCFLETGCIDDAIFSSLKMVEVISKSGKTFSEIANEIPLGFRSKMKLFDVPDQKKFLVVDKITEKVKGLDYNTDLTDGVKIYKNGKWVLIRASNTSPAIRVNAGGMSREDSEEMQKMGERLVEGMIRQ